MHASQAAFDLIVAEEVSSEKTYSNKYRRPEWPGASSGVTIGIGYDLGQTDKQTIRADWKGRVSADMLDVMAACSGKTGLDGKTATAQVRHLIDIPWDLAIAVHKECVVPRWEKRVAAALPNTDKLSEDCFGALLSLTFNRGPSFSSAGERYREMRAIKAHMASGEFHRIPAEFRSMKRLWPTLPGLLKRRDHEADLFAKGLKAPVAKPASVSVAAKPATVTKTTAGSIVVAGAVTAGAAAAHQSGVDPVTIGVTIAAVIVFAVIGFVAMKNIKRAQ